MGVVRRREAAWSWSGVEARDYASGASRHVLIGAADGAHEVEVRYFEIPAGGASALERHPHEHAVVILHGEAEILLGDRTERVGPGDAVFVARDELHQFRTVGDSPLGFVCAVRGDRAPRPA